MQRSYLHTQVRYVGTIRDDRFEVLVFGIDLISVDGVPCVDMLDTERLLKELKTIH